MSEPREHLEEAYNLVLQAQDALLALRQGHGGMSEPVQDVLKLAIAMCEQAAMNTAWLLEAWAIHDSTSRSS